MMNEPFDMYDPNDSGLSRDSQRAGILAYLAKLGLSDADPCQHICAA